MPLDTLRELGAKLLLNHYFADIGVVEAISIDTESDHARLKIAPHGELLPVELELFYRVEDDAFVLVKFKSERLWIENVLNRYAGDLRIDIDNPTVQALLKHLL